jgi:hypothetical protein
MHAPVGRDEHVLRIPPHRNRCDDSPRREVDDVEPAGSVSAVAPVVRARDPRAPVGDGHPLGPEGSGQGRASPPRREIETTNVAGQPIRDDRFVVREGNGTPRVASSPYVDTAASRKVVSGQDLHVVVAGRRHQELQAVRRRGHAVGHRSVNGGLHAQDAGDGVEAR